MKDAIKIGEKEAGKGKPVYIIAEIGMNHNGQFDLAERHIQVAAECGVDAVKFQNFKTELLYCRSFPSFKERKSMEMPSNWLVPLKQIADEAGVEFLSTPFDEESADLLDDLGIPCYKVASCDINNYSFLKYLAKKSKPIIVSTGFSDMDDVAKAVAAIRSCGNEQIILLHCVATYPSDIGDMNLKAIDILHVTFGCPVGLSDHTLDNKVVPITAVALGACIIEKHFTLDKHLTGYDHEMSMSPNETKKLIYSIRLTEKAIGTGIKQPVEAEIKRLKNAQRSLYWNGTYKEGTIVRSDMILCLRPADGLKPEMKDEICGFPLKRAVKANGLVRLNEIDHKY